MIVVGVCFNFMKIVFIIWVIDVVKVQGKCIFYCLVYMGVENDNSLDVFLFVDLYMKVFDVYLGVNGNNLIELIVGIMIVFECELIENFMYVVLVVDDFIVIMSCVIVVKK